MDIATVLGILSGFILITVSLAIGPGGVGTFFNLSGVLVVIGGTIAATLVMFPLQTVLKTFKVVVKAFTVKVPSPEKTNKRIINLAKKVRKESLLSLEKEKFSDKFLKKGIRLCIDGTQPAAIKEILSRELSVLKTRHKTGADLFEQMGMLAPAFGMIGTLIGLVQMLQTLSDPSAIGPAMAVALLTTFYGAVLANLIFIPISKKLSLRSKEESHVKAIIIAGVTGIAKRENPNSLSEKLDAFLDPKKKGRK